MAGVRESRRSQGKQVLTLRTYSLLWLSVSYGAQGGHNSLSGGGGRKGTCRDRIQHGEDGEERPFPKLRCIPRLGFRR